MERPEKSIYLEDILRVLGWSRAKFYRHRDELSRSGAIFYRWEGRPPKRRVSGFESYLKAWIALKSSKGEDV